MSGHTSSIIAHSYWSVYERHAESELATGQLQEVGRNSTDVSLHQTSVVLRQLDNAKYASPKVYKRLRTTVRGEVLPFYVDESMESFGHVYGQKGTFV
jgi:hypothetical protein